MNRNHTLTNFLVCQSICCLIAATALAQSLASRATSANSYVERGNAWFAQREYERAIAVYDLAIASSPNFAGAYYNRAFTRFSLGKLAEALADFKPAMKLAPDRNLKENPRQLIAEAKRQLAEPYPLQ